MNNSINSAKEKTIVICSDDYLPKIGGISTCTHELANAFVDLGWKVLLLTRSFSQSGSHDEKQKFEIIRVDVPSDSILSIPKYIKAIRKLRKQRQPDFFLHMSWLPCAAAHWLSRSSTPYGVYAHGVEILESNRTVKKTLRQKLRFLKRKIFKRASIVFAVSKFTAGLVETETGVASEKIQVVFNGVDTSKFYPLEMKPTETHKKVLLTVCRLQANKGVDQVLKALQPLKDQFEFTYQICGDGPERTSLEQLAQKLQLSENVEFLGALPESRLLKLYNGCDIFLMLSRYDQKAPAVEGFGITFLEAGSCKKPVIAGDSGGVSDAVLHQETGILVDPTDSQKISESIKTLLSDSELCKKLGENAHRRIHQELAWDHVGKNVSDSIMRKFSDEA